MDSKRIRFGFVCSNASPFTVEILSSLRVRSIECALSGERQFVIFTVEKPMKGVDVLKAITDFNTECGEERMLNLEKFQDSEDLIVTFEKGQRFLQHPFYAVIQEAKKAPVGEGEAPKSWEWTHDGIPESLRHKRAVGELSSDLVDDSIFPSAPKRDRSSKADGSQGEDPVTKKKKTYTTQQKTKSKPNLHPTSFGSIPSKGLGTSSLKSVSSVDVKIFSLVNEVTKSKDETIASKNYTIQLLETLLQSRKPCVCANANESL